MQLDRRQFIIGFTVFLTGCSSLDKDMIIQNSCDIKCKTCTELEFICKGGVTAGENSTSKGTISGPIVK